MITFNIAQWRAWAPGLDSVDDWHAWCHAPTLLPASDAAPDVSFLPAMQRRRLSRLARMAFSVGWPLAEGLQDLPLVFISLGFLSPSAELFTLLQRSHDQLAQMLDALRSGQPVP